MGFSDFIETYKDAYHKTLDNLNESSIQGILSHLVSARDNGNTIFVLGNGGSAASASHWVCDFNKGASHDRHPRFKVVCLSDNTPIVTALGNDVSYTSVFSEQLKNFLSEGDVVIALSVSGNSANLVEALDFANANGAQTLSIIGDYDGRLKEVAQDTLVVPSKNYGIVEDVHMYIAHVLSQYLAEHG